MLILTRKIFTWLSIVSAIQLSIFTTFLLLQWVKAEEYLPAASPIGKSNTFPHIGIMSQPKVKIMGIQRQICLERCSGKMVKSNFTMGR